MIGISRPPQNFSTHLWHRSFPASSAIVAVPRPRTPFFCGAIRRTRNIAQASCLLSFPPVERIVLNALVGVGCGPAAVAGVDAAVLGGPAANLEILAANSRVSAANLSGVAANLAVVAAIWQPLPRTCEPLPRKGQSLP